MLEKYIYNLNAFCCNIRCLSIYGFGLTSVGRKLSKLFDWGCFLTEVNVVTILAISHQNKIQHMHDELYFTVILLVCPAQA